MTSLFTRKVVIPELKEEAVANPAPVKEYQTESTASQPVTPRSPLTPLTPLSVASSSISGSTLQTDMNAERGVVVHQNETERGAMVVHQNERKGTSLVTVRSMSDEERNRLAHLEVSRKMEAADALHAREAEIFVEKNVRDALAEQYHAEAKAEKKFEGDMASLKYKEAQLRKKIENKLTQAMAEKTRQEILARQKFEERKIKAKQLAEEKIASAKVRGSAIRSGSVRAELGSKKKLWW